VFLESTYLQLYLSLAMAESFSFTGFINLAHGHLIELHGRSMDGRSARRNVTNYTG
jgi:hypothetical protein